VTLDNFLAEGTLRDFAEEMAMNEDEADFRGPGSGTVLRTNS
jgi:hypothetical protein